MIRAYLAAMRLARSGAQMNSNKLRNCSSTTSSTTSADKSLAETVLKNCTEIYESVQALNDKVKGPLDKIGQKSTVLPLVFLLGNHSSGKSSFVNYVCKRKVQTSGVAPTDDSFTIIANGNVDSDRDGLSFIGDPSLGFSGLRVFGPQLIHHTQLKIRANIPTIKDFMFVDSPGMIDSPMMRDLKGNITQAVMDRGYDFSAVCRWYAERADVILLFFDPDKPGTTGETLSVLTQALVGLEFKLYIILNKADQFRKIHDFARAYGSLCWNLSKVIHRKDLPRIFTMCLPPQYQTKGSGDQSASGDSLGQGLIDLEATREEVLNEVLNAPKRRVDNEISRLTESISILQMHCRIVSEVRKRYNEKLWSSRVKVASLAFASLGLPIGANLLSVGLFPLGTAVASCAAGLTASGVLHYVQMNSLNDFCTKLVREDSLYDIYKYLYSRKIYERDEYVASIWARIKDHLAVELSAEGSGGGSAAVVESMGTVSPGDLSLLERIVNKDIPKLRGLNSPTLAQ